jgi:D-sedoheptulose 7-phosphate isomerase
MPLPSNLAGVFSDAIADHLAIIRRLSSQHDAFQRTAALLCDCLRRGHKVIWCGNGGSAADAQHLAAELVGHFRRHRSPLASIALTTDSSVLTALANDFGYEQIFERQVEALCQTGDVVVGISTSAESANVCAGLRRAHELEANTIAIIGGLNGRMAQLADICLRVPSNNPARIQEGHILLGHMLCEYIDIAMAAEQEFENAGVLYDRA